MLTQYQLTLSPGAAVPAAAGVGLSAVRRAAGPDARGLCQSGPTGTG